MTRLLSPSLALCLWVGCQPQQAAPSVDASSRCQRYHPSSASTTAADDAHALPDIPLQDAISERLAGKVVRVIDGDSLVLLVAPEQGEPEEIRVRLFGIATPETDQSCGAPAEQGFRACVRANR